MGPPELGDGWKRSETEIRKRGDGEKAEGFRDRIGEKDEAGKKKMWD